MRHASTVLLPGLIALAALLAGCGPQQGTPRSQDILLVTVEGNIPAPDDGREYLPRTLVPVSPETLPSAASVLTGLFPPQHGLRVDGVGRLADDTPTLATRLRERGYETAAFLSSVALAPTHGLERGFSVYDVAIAPSNTATRFLRTADEIVDAALAYLDGPQTPDPAKPCFLWLHLSPYAGSTHTNTAAAAQASALNAQRGIPLGAFICYVGAEIPQRVDQGAYRAALHALRAREHVLAGSYGEICRHEAHGRAGGLDVDSVRHFAESFQYDVRVVAVRQVVGQDVVAGQRVDYQRPVADTFRRGQVNRSVNSFRGVYYVSHSHVFNRLRRAAVPSPAFVAGRAWRQPSAAPAVAAREAGVRLSAKVIKIGEIRSVGFGFFELRCS